MKAGKLQTGNTIPKQYWLAVNGKPKKEIIMHWFFPGKKLPCISALHWAR